MIIRNGGTVKLLYVVTEDWYFASHRLNIAKGLVDLGMQVALASGISNKQKEICDAGIVQFEVKFSRSSISPASACSAVRQLRSVLSEYSPDIVHCVALRPILLGSVALVSEKIPRVNTIAGMGTLFSGSRLSLTMWGVKQAVRAGLWFALKRRNTFNLFQNNEDLSVAVAAGMSPKERSFLIPGTGVDCNSWVPIDEKENDVPIVLFISRLLRDKGIMELVAASDKLIQEGIYHTLEIAGEPDPANPNSLTKDEVEAIRRRPQTRILGWRNDVLERMTSANIVALPSYREGLPRTLLEAGVARRAVVTSDVVGCRDVVRNGINGVLAKPKDVSSLSVALKSLLIDRDLRRRLAAAHRRFVEENYATTRATQELYGFYQRILFGQENEPD